MNPQKSIFSFLQKNLLSIACGMSQDYDHKEDLIFEIFLQILKHWIIYSL